MKVVIYFIDMLRVNDSKGRYKQVYEDLFLELGHGLLYKKAFTSIPNTIGSLNAFFFGVSASQNPARHGVYPSQAMGMESYLDIAVEEGYTFQSFTPESSGRELNFPSCTNHRRLESEEVFWQEVGTYKTNALFMFTDNDYHGAISDYSATKLGEKVADSHFKKRLPKIIELCSNLDVDKLLIFSDHGFLSSGDYWSVFNPLGMHRSGLLWYETNFRERIAIDTLPSPISKLSQDFFSCGLGLRPTRSTILRKNTDIDFVIEDLWLPPFLQVLRPRKILLSWAYQAFGEFGTTTLTISDRNDVRNTSKVPPPSMKGWAGSFRSPARISLTRPGRFVTIKSSVVSKFQILLQIVIAWVAVMFLGRGFLIRDLRQNSNSWGTVSVLKRLLSSRKDGRKSRIS